MYLYISLFFSNVEGTDLVRNAHEPTSKLLHPNAVHTLAVRNYLLNRLHLCNNCCIHNYEQAPNVLQKSIADR